MLNYTPSTVAHIVNELRKTIVGQDDVIEQILVAFLAEGHALLEGVPGTAKTLIIKTLAAAVGAGYSRIQFTPDLMPSDITGTNVFNMQTSEFTLRQGPIFTDILLADEINRASPKTQSALLEAMAEEQVTADGTTRPLTAPFLVIATQNPLEHHGTYPLPESQLDRFLMKLSIGYPSRADEASILANDGAVHQLEQTRPVATPETITAMTAYSRDVHVAPSLTAYLLDLASASRNHRNLGLGISPRAVLGLQRAMKVRAAALGRTFATADDLKALAPVTLHHRIVVRPEATVQGVTPEDVIDDLLRSVAVPATGEARS